MVDALASGASDRKVVKVRVLSWAPFRNLPSRGLAMAQAKPDASGLGHGEERRTELVIAGGDAEVVLSGSQKTPFWKP